MIYVLAVCLLVSLTACGGRNKRNSDSHTGGYTETDITPPVKGGFHSFVNEQGDIICYDYNLLHRYESVDGGRSWSESDGPCAAGGENMYVTACALCPDGSLIIYAPDKGLLKTAANGGFIPYDAEGFVPEEGENSFTNVSLLTVLGEDRLLLSYMGGGVLIQGDETRGRHSIQDSASSDTVVDEEIISAEESENAEHSRQYSSSFSGSGTDRTLLLELGTGRLIADIQAVGAISAASDDETLYLLGMTGEISRYELKDGKPAQGRNLSFGETQDGGSPGGMAMINSGGVLAAGDSGSIYAVHGKDLLSADASGGIQTVLSGADYAFGAPRGEVNSILLLPDGSILLGVSEAMQNFHLYKYTWDENAGTDPDKTITVWSLVDNDLVRAAIAEFRKSHQDTTVVYEIGISGDGGISVEDAIKTLGTRLLSSDGPDVLILDGCPMQSYAQKGMLLDLSGLTDVSGVYSNLISPYYREGALYMIPAQFYMPALIGNEDALRKVVTLEQLAAAARSGKDATFMEPGMGRISDLPEDERAELYFDDLRELCDVLWPACAPAVIKDGRVDSNALASFLSAARIISDKYNLCEDADAEERIVMGFAETGGPTVILTSSLMRYSMGQTNYGAFCAGHFSLLQMTMERAGSAIAPFPGLARGVFIPSTIAAVSADSHDTETAAAFVSMMISFEVQRFNYGTGLPVTKKAVESQIAELKDHATDSGGILNLDADVLISGLVVSSDSDGTLFGMMWGDIESFMKGETDLEGAMTAIENNVRNYLAERQ